MTRNFDAYTRDDLIAEIKAIELKTIQAVEAAVLENTKEERERLVTETETIIKNRQDMVGKELDELLLWFIMGGPRRNIFYSTSSPLYQAYTLLYQFRALNDDKDYNGDKERKSLPSSIAENIKKIVLNILRGY